MAVASPADRRRGALRLLGTVLAVALAVNTAPAQAAPKPTVKQLKKELAALQKESDALITDYYNGRIAHEKADKAEKAAREKLTAAQKVLDRESAELRRIAVTGYMNASPLPAMFVRASPGTDDYLRRLAFAQQLVDEQGARLSGFAQVRDTHRRAQQEAAARSRRLGDQVEDLADRKARAEKLIEKIRDKIDQLHQAPGVRRSDGTWVPQLPDGADHITPRMRLVRTLIQERFDVPFGIGCYRQIQDGGEHPLGRACDFMLSRGGAMPSAAEVERGDEIAEWAVKNARRLAIMYVIYRQRIWHVRTGTWRTMSDRGGATANHYDHPHISVY
ncbi:coiled-coil domain-containing protein [Nonomuraea sp. NPDC047897]|uniref:coiled-coil domain-containing protein n=1 Tax=Nonomuraea sp. NPDC047897 TaxID=3364346 RepID=UPI0037224B36